MPEVLPKILFCACLLALVLAVSACARDIEIQARGQMAGSVGVGNR
ncbi:MAG: hypothetical protein LBB66_00330 [Desulfovibrio sp.]|jgi:hypothetical protein|nr:hypothetical protein [Desulfovibrio sp.]